MTWFTEDRSTFVCHTNDLIGVRFVSPKNGFLRANLASSAQEQYGRRGRITALSSLNCSSVMLCQNVVLCAFAAASRNKLDRKDDMNTLEIKENIFS